MKPPIEKTLAGLYVKKCQLIRDCAHIRADIFIGYNRDLALLDEARKNLHSVIVQIGKLENHLKKRGLENDIYGARKSAINKDPLYENLLL
jgi:hypothetical protein